MSAIAEIQHHMPNRNQNGSGFQKGHPKYGGRKPGSRNKLGRDIRQDIFDGIAEVGFAVKDDNGNMVPGEGGIRGFVKWLGLNEPKVAAALLARIMPHFIVPGDPDGAITREEMEAQLKEFGLPAGLIEHFQIVPAPLDVDENPDPYGMGCDTAVMVVDTPAE